VDKRGRWFVPARQAVLPEINPVGALRKGTYVIVYKSEMRFQWEEAPVPPDDQGEVYQGRSEHWAPKRSDAAAFIQTKTEEVEQEHNGEVMEALILRVNVKTTPVKDVILAILNKEGIDGDAHLCWQLNGTERLSIKIGGGDEENVR